MLTAPSATINVTAASGQAYADVTYPSPVTATDIVGPTSLICVATPSGVTSSDLTMGGRFPVGTTTVTCTAKDAAQPIPNEAVASFFVKVEDLEPPTLSVPTSIAVNTDTGRNVATVSYLSQVIATDNVGVASLVCTPPSGGEFLVGTSTIVTCTATDTAVPANSTRKSFPVAVTDAEGPTLSVPASFTVNTDPGRNDATVTFNPVVGAADNVGVSSLTCSSPGVSNVITTGGTFPVGASNVTCTAIDTAVPANSTSRSFTVTVLDAEKPVLTVPANITTTTAGTTAAVTYSVTAADNWALAANQPACTATAGVTSGDLTRGGTFPVGASTVTCTATDTSGNVSVSRSFTVTVNKTGYSGLDGVYANGSKSRTSAVPLDFGFKGTTGARVNSSLARPSVKVYYAGTKCPGTRPASPTFTYPSGGSDYRYSESSLNWQFNWKPSVNGLQAGCYYVAVKSDQTTEEFDSTKGTILLTK